MAKRQKDKSKRLVVLNDLHCGHKAAICPPGFGAEVPSKEDDPWGYKSHQISKAIYQWFKDDLAVVRRQKSVDAVAVVGDAIDGRGERSGSTELITTDRHLQCRMAKKVINLTQAEQIALLYGTAYHTGNEEDFEEYLRDILLASSHVKNVDLGAQTWLQLKGTETVFDIKHHVGSSTIPHGRYTAIAKERLWNVLWHDIGEQPKADVILRAHTHYHVYCGTPEYLAMTLPCLQGIRTKFGGRRCSGVVHIGYTVFDIAPNGTYTWEARIARLPIHQAKVTVL
jgi:hypothetical protein